MKDYLFGLLTIITLIGILIYYWVQTDALVRRMDTMERNQSVMSDVIIELSETVYQQ